MTEQDIPDGALIEPGLGQVSERASGAEPGVWQLALEATQLTALGVKKAGVILHDVDRGDTNSLDHTPDDSLSIDPEIGKPILYEHSVEQKDGTTAYIRIYEDSFEINGYERERDTSNRQHMYDILCILFEHRRKPLISKYILNRTKFEERKAPNTRKNYLFSGLGLLTHLSRNSGLIQTGKLPGKVGRWYGIDVDEQLLDETLKRMYISITESRGLGIIESPPEPDQLYESVKGAIATADLSQESSQPAMQQETERAPSWSQIWDYILGLELSSIEREVVAYISGRSRSTIDLADLAEQGANRFIPVADIKRLLMTVQGKTQLAGSGIGFTFTSINTRAGGRRQFVEISYKGQSIHFTQDDNRG